MTLRRNPAYAVDMKDLDGEKARFGEARRLIDGYRGDDHISYGVRTEEGTTATYLENMALWLRATVAGQPTGDRGVAELGCSTSA